MTRIAQGTVCKILAREDVKPHRMRYPKSGSWVIVSFGRIGGICWNADTRTKHRRSPGG
jgi:hypothetical protein